MTALRGLLRDGLEWLILPAAGALLPWNMALRLYRRAAGWPWLMRQATQSALAAVSQWRAPADPRLWAQRFRLIHLVDRADGYISRFRSDRWLDRHLTVEGDGWPETPFIGITFHFGAGLWSIRHLCRGGRRASFLSRRFDARFFQGAPLRHAYARWRIAEVARAGRAPVIYTGGSVDRMRKALSEGVSVLGLVDVPPADSKNAAPANFLGQQAWFPVGLLRLATSARVPLAVFLVTLDETGHKRRLRIRQLAPGSEHEQLAAIAEELERAIVQDSAAWHYWDDLPLFFRTPQAALTAAP